MDVWAELRWSLPGSSCIQSRIYGLEYRLIAGKSNPALSCDKLFTDPNRKFACLSARCFNFNTEFLLKQCRYPSSTRRI